MVQLSFLTTLFQDKSSRDDKVKTNKDDSAMAGYSNSSIGSI